MKATKNVKAQLPRMSAIIRDWAKYKHTSLRKLSKKMGKGENYLQQSIHINDIRPSMLIAISKALEINLFDHYLALLPESIRATEREKALLLQIEAMQNEKEQLQKELEQVKAERDKYWEKIGR